MNTNNARRFPRRALFSFENPINHALIMKHSLAKLAVVSLVLATSACNRPNGASHVTDSAAVDSSNRARQDSINRTLPGYVVDSILPVDEELRRFRAAVGGDSISSLSGGEPTMDALVKRFVLAVQQADTSGLKKLLLSPREFAWLVYPESPYVKPPYTQSPALVWSQIQNPSASGFTRLIRRLGGKPLAYRSYKCPLAAERQGKNALWSNCIVSVSESNGVVRQRHLFGSILERDGTYKFVSFVNEF